MLDFYNRAFAEKPGKKLRRAVLAVIIIVILAIAVVGGYYAYSMTLSQNLNNVTLATDFAVSGDYAPIFYGIDQGIFSKNGINLKVDYTSGSSLSANAVVTGAAQFGLPDALIGSKLIASGANLTYVAMEFQSAYQGVWSWGQIKTPQDMVGKTIYTVAGGADSQILPALAAKAGVNMSSITDANIAGAAKYSSFASDQICCMVGSDWNTIPLIPAAKLNQTSFIPPSQFGLHIYANGLITTNTMIAQNPDLVRRFVQAFVQSYSLGMQNINASIDSLISHNPQLSSNKNAEYEEMVLEYKYWQSADTVAHGFGWMNSTIWQNEENYAVTYGGQSQSVPLNKLYTTQFLSGNSLPLVSTPPLTLRPLASNFSPFVLANNYDSTATFISAENNSPAN